MPACEETLMMRPPSPWAAIRWAAARMQRKTPRRLTAIVWSNPSSVIDINGNGGLATPALFTQMSTRPNRSMVCEKKDSTSAVSETSPV